MKRLNPSSESRSVGRVQIGLFLQRIGMGAWFGFCPLILEAHSQELGFEQANFQENLVSDFRKPELLHTLNALMTRKSKISLLPRSLPKTTKSALLPSVGMPLPEKPFEDSSGNFAETENNTPTHPPERQATLQLTWNEHELILDPLVITFPKKGDSVYLSAQDADQNDSEGSASKAPHIFVRDQEILQWEEGSHRFVAKAESGKTEVYITFQNQMLVVPVYIGPKAEEYFASREPGSEEDGKSEAPEDALQLTSIAITPSQIEEERLLAARNSEDPDPDPQEPVELKKSPTTGPVHRTSMSSGTVNFALQVVDDRSQAAGALFPLPGVVVKILGLDLEETTDPTGVIPSLEVPKKSRFFVSITDPLQRIRPAIVEMSVGDEDLSKPLLVKALRTKQYDGLLEVMNITSDPERASVCGQVLGSSGLPLKGIRVSSVNGELSGKPLYFSETGFPDERLERTGADGKFCWFNLESGPAALSFHDQNDQNMGTSLHSLFEGHHQEIAVNLQSTDSMRTRLVAMPTAYEYQDSISEDSLEDGKYRLVSRANVVLIGAEDPLQVKKRSLLVSETASLMWSDRTHYLTDSPEFEKTFYSYSRPSFLDEEAGLSEHVTPLVPRGFVEDMALSANLYYDPGLGSLLVDYGTYADESEESTHKIFLVDQRGNKFDEGVFFGSGSSKKALFVNLEPGNYTIVVEGPGGVPLSTNTSVVYSTILTYANSGNDLVYENSHHTSHMASTNF